MKKFTVSHTEPTLASADAIWSLWSNINKWPEWDVGLESCISTEPFEKGNTFELTPRGAPGAVKAVLTEVQKNKKFSDKSDLGFATVEAIHEIIAHQQGVSVTHQIIVNVIDEQAEFFEKKIWPSFQNGLPESVKKLVKIAEEKNTCAGQLFGGCTI